MQVSIKWLKDYIDFLETPEELADKLTMAGVPVENILREDAGLDKVVTGRLESVEPHQNSDHLKICTVQVGKPETLTIVTGASNVAAGQIVPVALVGAQLPTGQKIAKSKMRGVPSLGMLCSASELALDTTGLPEAQITGIFLLPEDTPVGVPVASVLGMDDVVLEFELTANRGDCFSVWGLVREIAVLTGNVPHWPTIAVHEEDATLAADMVDIGIEAEDLCARFSARVLTEVKIAPSPQWMQERLAGAGIRAINNVVDVTNFVMLELGQPLHAYDYDKVKGHRLTARRAKAGENLHTLDDSARLAQGEELVIADAEKPAGLAGIMGGLETEITEETTTVILEAASFAGSSIRRTARSAGLHSEASGRFERGIDETQTVRALDRAAQLLGEMGGARTAQGVVDCYPVPRTPTVLSFTTGAINRRLGTNLAGGKMTAILESLGFALESTEPDRYQVTVPSWRNDIHCWEDLSEEVARIYGFKNIPSTTPRGNIEMARESDRQRFVDEMKKIFCALGLNETISFSFMHPSMFDRLQVPDDSRLRQAIAIMNPLTDEYPLVRTTLLPNLFENAMRNFSRKNEDIRLFEVAPVFFPKGLPVTEEPHEVLQAAGLIAGHRQPLGWSQGKESVDFYDAKGIIEQLMAALSIKNYTVEAEQHFALHPGKSAAFKKGRDTIAVVGEVHPAVAAAFGAAKPMYVFEMDVPTLMKYASGKFSYQPLPKYPPILRDLAVLVADSVAAADIDRVMKKHGGSYLKEVTLFDVYTGPQVAGGKKSLAFTLHFQSNDKTLTDNEVDDAIEKVVAAVMENFKAELRA
ncbi:MAG: phenylalanine--tRNA ligase subunit beta [Schwartzia sp. (in: firmicutes)]